MPPNNSELSDQKVSAAATLRMPKPALRKWGHYLAIFVGACIFCIAIFVLHRELGHIDLADVGQQVRELPISNLVLAILFAACSYLMLTNYDRLAIKYLNRSLPVRKIMAISFTAYAVGNNVGISSLSGGSIRYRAYSRQGFAAIEIAKIIVFCSLTFSLGASMLLGVSLLSEPSAMLARLGIPTLLLRAFAVVLLSVPIVYLLCSWRLNSPLKLGYWSIAWPRLKISAQQILFSSADLMFAAGVLYVLLPESLGISYFYLLGAYLIAVGLGVISNVPGGLGVLEGMFLLLLPEIPQVVLLGALVGYRAIYYLTPLTFAVLLLTFQEFRVHRQRLSKTVSATGVWIGQVIPQVLGVSVFIAGAAMIIGDVVPNAHGRIADLERLVPLYLMEASNILSSAIGAALLILARGLYRRLHGAYLFALVLLAVGVVVSLLKGFDYQEALILLSVALILWLSKEEFYRPAALVDQRFTPGWLISVAMVIGGSIWLGFFQYQHVEYSSDLWWQFAVDGDVSRMLRASFIALLVAMGFGLVRLMRPAPLNPGEATSEDFESVRRILAESSSALDNVALLGDKRFLIHESGEAFIMYQISGSSWIAMGDPVGKPEYHEALAWQFRELSDHHGGRCVFYQVSDDHLPIYLDLGLSLSKLGEEAKVDLTDFTLEGPQRADLRQAKNRAAREGASFEVIQSEFVAPILPDLRSVSDAWLADRGAKEKGFSLGTFDEQYLLNFDIAVVRVEGAIVAFANVWKSGNKEELSLDLMRYSDRAPKGVMDYLFTELMLWGRIQGYHYFALGSAPLSGLEKHSLATLWHKIGNTIYRFGDHFYKFDGLRKYKEKFYPIWEPIYLAAPGGLAMSGVLIDSTILISGGVQQVFRK